MLLGEEPMALAGGSGLRIGTALHLVGELLAAGPSHGLAEETIEALANALAHSAKLAASVPIDLPSKEGSSSRRLVDYIGQLTEWLRRAADGPAGTCVLVPVGWLNVSTGTAPAAGPDGLLSTAGPAGSRAAQPADVLLALRRSEEGWDMAVCSASAGLGYHPCHGEVYDPVLVVRRVRSERLLDSAPWVMLYRELAFSSAVGGAGARTLYEVVIPFLSGCSLPQAVARSPPPAEFSRRPAPLGDRTRAATVLEGVHGLLWLCGVQPTVAVRFTLQLRRLVLCACRHQLGELRASKEVSLGTHDHALITAGCRGLAAHAAEASALPLAALPCDACGGRDELAAAAAPADKQAHPVFGIASSALPEAALSAVSDAELVSIAKLVSDVGALADELHARALGTAQPSLALPINCTAKVGAASGVNSSTLHGLFSRVARAEDVEQLAGTPPDPPFLRPVRLTAVASRVGSVAEVSLAMQHAILQCTLLANQAAMVKNSGCLRVALLQHLFTCVVPLPLPLDSPERTHRCFWHSASVTYHEQAGLIRQIGALAQHYAAATLCLTPTREADGARLVTVACISALLDALLRIQASDLPALISRHYAGTAGEPAMPFGFAVGTFADESHTLKLMQPELAVARGMLLDYFTSVQEAVAPAQQLFRWERPAAFGEGELALAGRLACEMGFGGTPSEASAPGDCDERAKMLTGESPELLGLCPELATLRDVLFLLRLFMVPTADGLPSRKRWRPCDARLAWSHTGKGGTLCVRGFGRDLVEGCLATGADRLTGSFSAWFRGRDGGPRLRTPPSHALPAFLVAQLGRRGERTEDKLSTEEAILFLSSDELHAIQRDDGDEAPRLPSAGSDRHARSCEASRSSSAHMASTLSARDAELLLQYLTAPYLRIPLLLSFFADPLRIQALAQPRIQEVVEACLFEPGPWQAGGDRPLPETIPISREKRTEYLATPLGLLFNELVHAPAALLLSPILKMLAAATEMDTGSPDSASAAVILFTVRLAVRIDCHLVPVAQ